MLLARVAAIGKNREKMRSLNAARCHSLPYFDQSLIGMGAVPRAIQSPAVRSPSDVSQSFFLSFFLSSVLSLVQSRTKIWLSAVGMGCCASKPVHEKQPLLEGDHDIYAAHNAGTATATAGSADHDDDLKFEAPIQRANLQPASPQQPRPVSTRQLPPTALALQAAQAAMEQAVVESRKASLPVSEGGDPSAHVWPRFHSRALTPPLQNTSASARCPMPTRRTKIRCRALSARKSSSNCSNSRSNSRRTKSMPRSSRSRPRSTRS